jgi:hypothetical protein
MARHRANVNYTKYCYRNICTDYGEHYNTSYHKISHDGNVISCQIIIVDDTEVLIKPYRKIFEI